MISQNQLDETLSNLNKAVIYTNSGVERKSVPKKKLLPCIQETKKMVSICFSGSETSKDFIFLQSSLESLEKFIAQASGKEGVMAVSAYIELFHRLFIILIEQKKIIHKLSQKNNELQGTIDELNKTIEKLLEEGGTPSNGMHCFFFFAFCFFDFLQKKVSSARDWRELLSAGKFARLSCYFEGMTIGDVASLGKTFFVSSANNEDRPLMALFFKDELQKPLSEMKKATRTKQKQEQQQHRQDKAEEFNFSGKICSSTIKNLPQDKIFINDLSNKIKEKPWDRLDLSRNELIDKDIPLLKELPTLLPNLRTLNLANNRIHGRGDSSVDDTIKSLLEKLDFLVLLGNPIASVDRIGFWSSLNADQLEKLIWIPESWVEPRGWIGMIPDLECQEAVVEAHQKFYK